MRAASALATKFTVPSRGRAPGSSSRKTLLAMPSGSAANASPYSTGSAGVKAGSPRASRVVGTVTSAALVSSVPRVVATRTPTPLQSIAVTGQSSTTSRVFGRACHHRAEAFRHRPVDVGVLGVGEIDGGEVRRVHAHRPAHDRVEQGPELQIRRQHGGGCNVTPGPRGGGHRLDGPIPSRHRDGCEARRSRARVRSTAASRASARSP